MGAMMMMGSAYQAYNQYRAGKAEKQMYEMNAKLIEAEAAYIQQMGEYEAEDRREEYKRDMSTQRARVGAAGVDIFSGSPIEAYEETVREGEKDVERIRASTAWAVYSKRMGAIQQRTYGGLAVAEGWAKSGATVMSGASGYYSQSGGQSSASQFFTGGLSLQGGQE